MCPTCQCVHVTEMETSVIFTDSEQDRSVEREQNTGVEDRRCMEVAVCHPSGGKFHTQKINVGHYDCNLPWRLILIPHEQFSLDIRAIFNRLNSFIFVRLTSTYFILVLVIPDGFCIASEEIMFFFNTFHPRWSLKT